MPIRDPNLPHQPVLELHGNHVVISCNCRRIQTGTRYHYEAMGIVANRYDTQTLYNNPAMHWNISTPFNRVWEIHYKDVEPFLVRNGVSVNDGERWDNTCWICGDPKDHDGDPHSVATGDGLTRYDIVDFMKQGEYTWRDAT